MACPKEDHLLMNCHEDSSIKQIQFLLFGVLFLCEFVSWLFFVFAGGCCCCF